MNCARTIFAALAALILPTAALAEDAPCPPFEVTGTGPDLVLVPGLGSPPAVWDRVKDSLARDYRLHLVHVAGFPSSPLRKLFPGNNRAIACRWLTGAGGWSPLKPPAFGGERFEQKLHLCQQFIVGQAVHGRIAARR